MIVFLFLLKNVKEKKQKSYYYVSVKQMEEKQINNTYSTNNIADEITRIISLRKKTVFYSTDILARGREFSYLLSIGNNSPELSEHSVEVSIPIKRVCEVCENYSF